jgi:hypothetical protein
MVFTDEAVALARSPPQALWRKADGRSSPRRLLWQQGHPLKHALQFHRPDVAPIAQPARKALALEPNLDAFVLQK